MLKVTLQPVYLSPHLDDAILSCGGLIHRQGQLGCSPIVITCCAGVPDYRVLSPFALEQHHRWGQLVGPLEQRRCEDATALIYLGAKYQHWDYLDCIYRRHPISGEFLYASEEGIFGQVHSVEWDLAERLTADVVLSLSAEATLIYAPLAVGQHVDHQVVLKAALRLREEGFRVQFYEDYPYAGDPSKLDQALQRWTCPPTPFVQTIREQDLEAKVSAIALYRSQLAVLFEDEASMSERVHTHALTVSAGKGYAERYWQGGLREYA
ncbi:MAG: PIG-L family deacetylase [Chloroflexi bacterium]|nr:PIG-L family deacetylase [Chloroflexota bacterium]